jgi:formate hydrogenlyase subunit 3/multisubunit Na+/H+ antiporter MnhD subunit
VAELAFGFPAAGALLVSLFHRRRALSVAAGLAFGLAGLLATGLAVPGQTETLFGLTLRLAAPGQVVLAATFLAAGLAVLFVPAGADRVPMLASVLAGLAAAAAVAILANPLLVALVLLLVAAVHSALPALRPFAERVRAPAFGALLILLGALVAAGATNPVLARLAGLALVLGVTAAIGVAPYLQSLDPREPAPASPIAWLGFLGPALVVALTTRFAVLIPGTSAPGYAVVLLGLGIFNLGLGIFGAWRSKPDADLWRYSFVGEWGLVLVGFGLLESSGSGGAYLLLLNLLLLRLPLYLLARPALVRAAPAAKVGPLTLLVAAALAGAAPFAGFPARLLILRGASVQAWPFALILVAAMLGWLPQSIRLAQTLGTPTGRVRVGLVVVLLLNLALGLFPNAVLLLLGNR